MGARGWSDGDIKYRKVPGTRNPADLMTKVLGYATIEKHMAKIAQEPRKGAAKESLVLA